MPVELTSQQKLAVESRGKELIVSAAAGSGKTAVLVSRVIALVCDAENPVDLDRLLVVTFTNAAAAEMRGRIADAISHKLADSPSNRRLRRQLALLPECRIQTIHAFCQDLLRRNFTLAGIAPDFILLDQNQSDILKEQAMERLLEEEYEINSQGFRLARANICEERGDKRLQAVVFDVYEKLRSHPAPAQWLEYISGRQISSPQQTGWGSAVLQQATELIKYSSAKLRHVAAELAKQPEIDRKYKPAIDYCLHFAETLYIALSTGWDDVCKCLHDFEKPEMKPAPKGTDKNFTAWIRSERDSFCDTVELLKKSGLSKATNQILREEASSAPIIGEICRLVSRYEAVYSEIKSAKNSLDFSDLEHLALGLLIEDGKKTSLACELSAYLAEVLVDEYQDTNEIQERIFQSLVPEGGAFFVGDVKQSIYRFRLADPNIFIDRLESSNELEHAKNKRRARLALSKNFRSLPPVIELCNHVFSRIMSRGFGGVDYDESHRLHAAREGECGPCELHIIETDGLNNDDEISEEKAELEARLAASRVAEMLNNQPVLEEDGSCRPARPSDFAILLSSYSNKEPYFRKALMQAGIAVSGHDHDDFFHTAEITSLLSLLRSIDNRQQDIPLVSTMKSPLFGFTADDLACIRVASPGTDFYSALEAFANKGNKKSSEFIACLDRYSDIAQDMSVSHLVRFLCLDTMANGVFSAFENGKARAARLESFCQMASSFEEAGATSLQSFLRYIDRLISANEKIAVPGGTGGVEIMSIHKSKGLEFPFVIIPDLAKQFNREDTKGGVLFHKDLGLGITVRDVKLRAVFKNASYMAISEAVKREAAYEEMRKLYVAMTRARQQTILIMSLKDAPSKLKSWIRESGPKIAPQFLSAQAGAAPWICAALLDHDGAAALRALCGNEEEFIKANSQLICKYVNWRNINTVSIVDYKTHKECEQLIDYSPYLALALKEYKHSAVSALPSKITPTGARQMLTDAGEIEGQPGMTNVRRFRNVEQKIITTRAARRGQANHTLISRMALLCPSEPYAIESEIKRLVTEGFLQEQDAALIDVGQIKALLSSPAMQRVRAALEVRREYQFSVMLAPGHLAKGMADDEQIMLSGSIDILLINGDNAEIIDFKTDNISLGQEQKAAEKHRLQLELYAMAAEQIFGVKEITKTVFFLKTGLEAQI